MPYDMAIVFGLEESSVGAEMTLSNIHAELAMLLKEMLAKIVNIFERSRALTADVKNLVRFDRSRSRHECDATTMTTGPVGCLLQLLFQHKRIHQSRKCECSRIKILDMTACFDLLALTKTENGRLEMGCIIRAV